MSDFPDGESIGDHYDALHEVYDFWIKSLQEFVTNGNAPSQLEREAVSLKLFREIHGDVGLWERHDMAISGIGELNFAGATYSSCFDLLQDVTMALQITDWQAIGETKLLVFLEKLQAVKERMRVERSQLLRDAHQLQGSHHIKWPTQSDFAKHIDIDRGHASRILKEGRPYLWKEGRQVVADPNHPEWPANWPRTKPIG